MSDHLSFDPYALPESEVQDPPVSLWDALKKIGPGIILAGTIVGSGELLLTTSLGAQHGYLFLWLILFSCIIKVFVQTELGRYAIASGKPTLGALNELPGPRAGANWLTWWWLIMMLCTIFQLGAMTGAVGQALNLSMPSASLSLIELFKDRAPSLATAIEAHPESPWALLTCLTTIALLWRGDYRRIEVVTTALVVGVTLLTVTAAVALPLTKYPIHWPQVGQGLMFGVPAEGVAVAFGVFGITGVGATELFYYPYWCLEKGYARYVGKCDESEAWKHRAKGWIRVMHLDAWVSMVVFTISTLAFYVMGAAVLHPQGLVPEKENMIETLSRMFIDTFGGWTQLVFLIGAAAVLFKTLYLSSAGNGRLAADFLSLGKFVTYRDSTERARMVHWLSISIPVLAFLLFMAFKEPKWMVVVGGFGQALTLPMITAATIFFRYRKLDRRLTPAIILDICLWIALVSITVVAGYALYSKFNDLTKAPPPAAATAPAVPASTSK
ncbi:MAG: Nramp family divalent metal transporter [Planctomycetaceae bacterium]